ncbi:hypothetical protein I4U23_022193 [Adineta vaga]|nr:hypothetical protein I4U23_022193 [Adineta vaga]
MIQTRKGNENNVNYKTIYIFLNDVLPTYGHHIQCLKLHGAQQQRAFYPYLQFLTNLESLTLKPDQTYRSSDSNQLNQFIIKSLSLNTLNKFSLSTDKNTLKTLIRSASCHLTNLILIQPHHIPPFNYFGQMLYIKCLSIELNDDSWLKNILQLMPNLIELNLFLVDKPDPFYLELHDSFHSQIQHSIEKLYIKFGMITNNHYLYYKTKFRWIESFLNNFKKTLKSLTLVGMYVENNFANIHQLQSLIDDFSQLETFQYHIQTSDRPDHCVSNYNINTDNQIFNNNTLEIDRLKSFTKAQLFMCTKFDMIGVSSQIESLLSFLKLKNNPELVNLKEIVCLYDSQNLSFTSILSKLINLSPNLQIISICNCNNTNLAIKQLKELVLNRSERIKNIKYINLPSTHDNFHSLFFSDLSKLFPKLQVITFSSIPKYIDEKEITLLEMIQYLRNHFIHLTHLKLQIMKNDGNFQRTLDNLREELSESMKQNKLYYTTEKQSKRFVLSIWL